MQQLKLPNLADFLSTTFYDLKKTYWYTGVIPKDFM